MKLNKKIIIPAFTLLVGTTLAGSVASTVAWYQYSTRTNVSYIGTSAGTIGNLQIRLKGGEWGTRLSIQDVNDYLSAHSIGQAVEPITSGPMAKNEALKKYAWKEIQVSKGDAEPSAVPGENDPIYYIKEDNHKLYKYVEDAWQLQANEAVAEAPELASANTGDLYLSTANKLFEKAYVAKDFYENPIAGFASYEKWIKADQSKYVKLPLQLRFMGEDENSLSAQNVYISKLLIQEDMHNDDVEAHGDISDAVRVHFSAYETGDEENAVNRLVSKNGGTSLTHGKLKLGGGNDFDKAYADDDEFGFGGSALDYINYGGTEGVQTSYAAKVSEEPGVYYEEEAPISGWTLVGSFNAAAGEPTPASGSIGDFYLDTATNKIYKKVADNSWGVFAETFSSGTAAPDLESDDSEKYYVDSAASKIYECGFHNETISPILVSNEADSLEIGDITDEKKLGETVETAVNPNPQNYLNVDVTIWIEGWQKFNRGDKLTSIWDQDLIGAIFDVGIQFAVQDIR